MCDCSPRYPLCNAYVPHCRLWLVRLFHIFLHHLINIIECKMCGFIFFTTVTWNISHSKKNRARYIKNAYWSSCTVTIIIVRFEWNLNFLDKFFKKYSNIKFHENPSSGSRVVPCRRTNGQTYMAKLIVAIIFKWAIPVLYSITGNRNRQVKHN